MQPGEAQCALDPWGIIAKCFLHFFLCLEFKAWPLRVEFNQVSSPIPQRGNKSSTGKVYFFDLKKVEKCCFLSFTSKLMRRDGGGRGGNKRSLEHCLRSQEIKQCLDPDFSQHWQKILSRTCWHLRISLVWWCWLRWMRFIFYLHKLEAQLWFFFSPPPLNNRRAIQLGKGVERHVETPEGQRNCKNKLLLMLTLLYSKAGVINCICLVT